jgi:hypothetical protein
MVFRPSNFTAKRCPDWTSDMGPVNGCEQDLLLLELKVDFKDLSFFSSGSKSSVNFGPRMRCSHF